MSRELTAGGWRKLARDVAERSARAGAWPSPDARAVLHAVLVRFGAGEAVPAQEVFARELGMTERRLRGALQELKAAGLLAYDSRPGSAPAVYEVWEPRVRAWAAGELVQEAVSGDDFDPTTGDDFRPTNGGSGDGFGPTASRARVHAAEVVDQVAADHARQRAEDEAVKAAVAELRAGGVRCPLTVQTQVREWVRRGMTADDFAIAAAEAGDHGAQWAYARAVIERRYGEATGGRVSHIEDFRVIQPWGAGGAS